MHHSKPFVLVIALSSFVACASNTSDTPAGSGSEAKNARGRRAYVGLFGDNAVAVVDTEAARVITTIPVSAPDGLVIEPDGAKVYVSSNNGTVVEVIDTTTDTVERSVDVGMQPAGLSITPDGRYVVVSVQGDGEAAIIDTATDTVLTEAPVGKAHNSALSSDGALAFVASQVADAPAVKVVAVPSGAPGADFALSASPRALAELNGKLYATMAGSGDVSVLDATSGATTRTIPTGGSPHDIRPTSDGASLLTVSQTAGELEVIDPTTASVVGSVATGKMPHWIGLSKDGALAYVTNEGDDNLTLIDLSARIVKRSIVVGSAPRKVAIGP